MQHFPPSLPISWADYHHTSQLVQTIFSFESAGKGHGALVSASTSRQAQPVCSQWRSAPTLPTHPTAQHSCLGLGPTSASHPEVHTVEMVYCGKPSKGCSNCRERKIRVSHNFYLSSRLFSNSVSMGWLRNVPAVPGPVAEGPPL